MFNQTDWVALFQTFLAQQMAHDAAHDLAHIQRVVANAWRLNQAETGEWAIVLPAAWLHDCVNVAKDSPQRPYASRLAADTAVAFLGQIDYPAHWLPAIHHAIAAHSFSAGIAPQTLEAQIVQDADRLDAIGAIGIARCFALGGSMGRPLYHPVDPFCQQRPADDALSNLDHFYTKLLTLAATMQTASGRAEAHGRTQFIRQFLAQLQNELEAAPISP